MTWIGSIAGVVILVVAAGSFALNVSEHRRADEKLRQLAQRVVQSQEDERARLSRDLHDGISQSLVSVKLLVDTALARLKAIATSGNSAPADVTPPGRDAAELLNVALHRLNRRRHA